MWDSPSGPPSIEFITEEHQSIPGTIARAVQAQQAGYDSILLGFYADPSDALREVRTIPVAGPLESSAATALTLGHRFSIVIAGNAPRAGGESLRKGHYRTSVCLGAGH